MDRTLIPDRLFSLLRSSEDNDQSHFPATEIFNEGWMLRLVLDVVHRAGIQTTPFSFTSGARWYSEALLSSPFRPRQKSDPLGEGFTNADAVIGHFRFDLKTKAGLQLLPSAKQFVVIEAKMFSNLSAGTKNAPGYDQAARNVACMAATMERLGQPIEHFESVGFFVIAPEKAHRRAGYSNLEECIEPDSIKSAVHNRIAGYKGRPEEAELRSWEQDWFLPLVKHLSAKMRLAVVSWEKIIADLKRADAEAGEELQQFYKRCLDFGPAREPDPANI